MTNTNVVSVGMVLLIVSETFLFNFNVVFFFRMLCYQQRPHSHRWQRSPLCLRYPLYQWVLLGSTLLIICFFLVCQPLNPHMDRQILKRILMVCFMCEIRGDNSESTLIFQFFTSLVSNCYHLIRTNV